MDQPLLTDQHHLFRTEIRRKNFVKWVYHQIYDKWHTWYLSPRSPTCRWRRNLPCGEISDFNTWNFSTWRGISVFPHNRCGEMWIFAKFGEISHFSTGQMWRNLKFIQFLVIKSVLRCFCEIRFNAIYALLRGEIFCKKLGRWRKNDKYQVWKWVIEMLTHLKMEECENSSWILLKLSDLIFLVPQT